MKVQSMAILLGPLFITGICGAQTQDFGPGVAYRMHELGFTYRLQQQQQQQPNGSYQGCMANSVYEEFVFSAIVQGDSASGIKLSEALNQQVRSLERIPGRWPVLECKGSKITPYFYWYDNTQRQQYSNPTQDPVVYRDCLAMGGEEEKCRQSSLKYGEPPTQAQMDCENREKNKVPDYKIMSCRIVQADQQRLQAIQQYSQKHQQQQQRQQPQQAQQGGCQ